MIEIEDLDDLLEKIDSGYCYYPLKSLFDFSCSILLKIKNLFSL